jgi:hypothetical protein
VVSSLRSENNNLQSLSELSLLQKSLEKDSQSLKAEAESNLSVLKSLELIHNMCLVRAESSSLTVRFGGFSSDSDIYLHLTETSNGFVCLSTLGNKEKYSLDVRSPNRIGVFTEPVKDFVDQATAWFINHRTHSSFSTFHDIVMNLVSYLNRLHVIGKEISNLTRRYTGKLLWSDDFSAIDLNLLLGHRKNGRKYEVVATFHLNLSYPFVPLEVDIACDGIIIEDLEHLLVKNAKPGIGYLTRSCDVISAFLRTN